MSDLVRQNAVLFVIIAVCLGGAVYGFLFSSEETAQARAQTEPARAPLPKHAAPDLQPVPPRLTREERTQVDIDQLAQDVEANPEDADTPARLHSLGNLNWSLGNYDEAIRYFELLVNDHPDWDGIRKTYINLASCYQETGRTDDAYKIWQKMTEVFPPGSPEHDFAKGKLDPTAPVWDRPDQPVGDEVSQEPPAEMPPPEEPPVAAPVEQPSEPPPPPPPPPPILQPYREEEPPPSQ